MAAWRALVRFGFRLLYNEFAFTYDWVSYTVSLGAWRCWQRAALKHLRAVQGSRVMELAHGTGNLQADLHVLGYRVIGYDLSAAMGRIARRKMAQAGIPIRLARGRAQQLPFADASFAAVISTFPTNFILEEETLYEVKRVLQPGGQFLIVPNGVLNSGGVTEAGIEWLYRVTGQRETDDFDVDSFFAAYGFEARILEEPCPRSTATVIVAGKKTG